MFLEGSKFKVCDGEDLKSTSTLPAFHRRSFAPILARSARSVRSKGSGAAELCIDLGYGDDDIHAMVSTNAAKAFGLEDDVKRAKAAKH